MGADTMRRSLSPSIIQENMGTLGSVRRRLQQEEVIEEVVVVKTAQELQDAVVGGARHIEIREHLDLTTLELIETNPFMFLLGIIPPSVKSIRGNCAEAPDFTPPAGHAPLHPIRPRQCLILSDASVVFLEASPLWIDGIYIRLTTSREGPGDPFAVFIGARSKADLWMTGVTLQGNGDGTKDCLTCGIGTTRDAKTHCQDCILADFDGNRVVDAQNGGSVSLRNCTVSGNTILAESSGNGTSGRSAVIHTRAWEHRGGEIRMEECTLLNNSMTEFPILFSDNRGTDFEAVIYSDVQSPAVCTYEGPAGDPELDKETPPECDFKPPKTLGEAEKGAFLNTEDAWFISVQKVQAHAFESEDSPELGKGFIAAVVAGGAVLLLAVVAGILLFVFRRCRNSGGRSTLMHEMKATSTSVLVSRSSDLTSLQPPKKGATDGERKLFLRSQLASLRGVEVLGGLLFQEDIDSQADGGQAVVQMATSKVSRMESAIKFFLSRAAFECEARQYTHDDNPLWRFLPACRDIIDNKDSRLVDRQGRPLPPCIVMEKGESLDRWMRRSNCLMDRFTCMQIIHHICECLADLHSAGYVHRDLKPANIMWLPSQNRWTLIDFGCAARIGHDSPTGFTLAYAAPEAVRARFRDKRHTITANESLDAWSVGVLAVELFNGRPALVQFHQGRDKVVAMIVGEEQLPWEGEAEAKEMLKTAGRYKEAVLGLLHRDPAQRSTVQCFVQQYASILSTTTQQGSTPWAHIVNLPTIGDVHAGDVGQRQHRLARMPATEFATASSWV